MRADPLVIFLLTQMSLVGAVMAYTALRWIGATLVRIFTDRGGYAALRRPQRVVEREAGTVIEAEALFRPAPAVEAKRTQLN